MIVQGDCLEAMRGMEDNSVTAIVTDPPYALQFMGKGWDKVLPSVEVWKEALRVLKPGGVALVFGGTRTFHRLTCSLEDAGFQIRDVLCWLYGAGFPKSLAIDKAIDRQRYDVGETLEVTRWIREARDRAGIGNRDIDDVFGLNGMAGHWTSITSQPAVPTLEQVPQLLEVLGGPEVPERIQRLLFNLNGKRGEPGPDWLKRAVVGSRVVADTSKVRAGFMGEVHSGEAARGQPKREVDLTTAATDRSRPWEGYGTALKPAWEPIVLAMKPLDGTFAANALEHGVAGINVDGCRVGTEKTVTRHTKKRAGTGAGWHPESTGETTENSGRWPANVVHDGSDDVEAGMPRSKDGVAVNRNRGKVKPSTVGFTSGHSGKDETYGGGGSASRFFYCAKASKKDRNFGLPEGTKSNHPTVKPINLMRWLVRMVKMPSDTLVLDPFTGSGSTGVACALEGVDFLGVEREAEYVEIAKRRIQGATE